jgi:hypothetical protein
MTNNLGPNPQQNVLRPYMLARLHDMTIYLQLPEGGVKTTFPNKIFWQRPVCRYPLAQRRLLPGMRR